MATLTFNEKINSSGESIVYGQKLVINSEKLIGNSTKSLYIRKGFLNGTLFLSQKGQGSEGKGDICKIHEDITLDVNSNLFHRLKIYAENTQAIIEI